MRNEFDDIARTLIWAAGMVLQSGPADRRRIARAYRKAQKRVADIPTDNGDARPRIVACFAAFDGYKDRKDVAGVGWLLTAIQERVKEHDLPDWQALNLLVDDVLEMLGLVEMTVH
ncbi:hypothetical protein C8J35_1802 [Rhizobium sp. PP-F2F-G38]|nr:hypothetical protein C8J37_1572 [Rhizobium sp. PP-WC-1G-195]PYE90919.1 hypothetical protein C8J35_1802 [Rhizobium sp. PP-F2F-G38]TCP72259.1 hypothetical protein C8J31_1712 [Rhizobium sp. PP-CC-2G-626]